MIENFEPPKYQKNLLNHYLALLHDKDIYTYNHSTRVAALTKFLCKRIGLPKNYTTKIVVSAFLHDVGKLLIPKNILCGTKPLSKKEWDTMKQHPAIGRYFLESRLDDEEILNNIACHHERLNGNGYPSGLTEKEIPFGAKIIAVADSIDAMLTNRSYRHSLNTLKAKEEIKNGIGTNFDRRVANAALQSWTEIEKMYS